MLTENDVFIIEEVRLGAGDEELAAICVRAGVGLDKILYQSNEVTIRVLKSVLREMHVTTMRKGEGDSSVRERS